MLKASILMIGNYLPSTRWNKNVWHFMAERLQGMGWHIVTTSSKERPFFRLLDMLWTILKERHSYQVAQIDVFSGRAFIYTEVSSRLLSYLDKPFILTLHGGRLPEFSNQYPKRIRRVLESAAAVVTPSPFIQSAFADFREDIRLIPNPIDLSTAIFRLREKPSPRLIWVRAFHQVYNPSLAVDVVSELCAGFPQIHLTMLGPDKGDNSLDQMLERAVALGVEDKLEVVGGVPHTEIPIWLDKSDILINTSNYDTAPRSLLEAMANGLCVVSTNVGGIPYIIEHGVSGLLVSPNDPKAMAESIQMLLTTPGLAESLSISARKCAEQNDWSSILPQWDQLFYEVLESTR